MARRKQREKKDKTLLDLESLTGNRLLRIDSKHRPYTGKFRFQIACQWINSYIPKGKVADIGGGKGLLTYFLITNGWNATVIDPVKQSLPRKYKDIVTDKRVIIDEFTVPYIETKFNEKMAKDFDILIGLHTHGSNVKIINAASEYKKSFLIIPCCVIDEPFYPVKNTTWVLSLADYAIRKGFKVFPLVLNFSGQNIGIYGEVRNKL